MTARSTDDRSEPEGALALDPNLPPPAVDAQVLEEEQRRWTPLRIAVWVGVALLGGLAGRCSPWSAGRRSTRLVRLRRGVHLLHRLPLLCDATSP